MMTIIQDKEARYIAGGRANALAFSLFLFDLIETFVGVIPRVTNYWRLSGSDSRIGDATMTSLYSRTI